MKMHKIFNPGRRVKSRLIVGFMLVMLVGLTAGYFQGYYNALGVLPSLPWMERENVLPVVGDVSKQTFEEVSSFVQTDITNKEPYQEGMNCMDYALIVARNAHWQGLGADVIGIEFVDPSLPWHAVLIFPTNDMGWQFYDPQTDKLVYPEVGRLYDGKMVKEVYILTYEWVPLDKFIEELRNEYSK